MTDLTIIRKDSKTENWANNKDGTMNKVDYEQLLASAGEFGWYQLWLLACGSPFYIFAGYIYFAQLFMTEVSPDHWCYVPELQNLTVLERRSLAIPLDRNSPKGYSHCTAYVANWTDVLHTGQKPNYTWSTIKCSYGWEFDKTEIPYPTIASEMGWVCDKDSYQATAQALFFVGSIIGGFVIGWVSDRFGRIPAAVFANLLGCIGGVASAFTRSFLEFAICCIFKGMSYDNCMSMIYLLVLEYTVPKYRSLVTNLYFAIFFTIGLVSLPWIALACDDWKVLTLATSIPLVITLLAPLVMPESPRWLLSKGRVDEVVKNIYVIGKRNNKEISQKMVEQFKASLDNNIEESGSIIDLIKRPRLRNLFILVCLQYLCCVIVFDTSVRTIGSLNYDFFVSFTAVSFSEFPSLVLLSFILDFIGRKWLCIVVMINCAVFSFMTPFVGGGLPAVVCAVIARFSVNMAFNAIIQWSAELMPTPVRGSTMSIIHTSGYVARVISPFIGYLDRFTSWLSMIVIGCVALITSLLSLYLPETALKQMPQTFQEAEDLIANNTFMDIPCLRKEIK